MASVIKCDVCSRIQYEPNGFDHYYDIEVAIGMQKASSHVCEHCLRIGGDEIVNLKFLLDRLLRSIKEH